ncbi:uncharacterized protein PV09_00400 [Verruconis gallopava]|uniref:Uncharacterized protein n=1 Tax=Verruconis gallopava TaxID=253628 RepID=A0A0D2BDR7_9PEZI|nr:uncharacterized protein PV09_00400 [Verruconis gallopava]KIW09524.1 hypothetical protein PV09_00400 [Verruconis gallopava]
MTSRAPSRNAAVVRNASNALPAPSQTATASVRRNLFPQAARRQAQHVSASSASAAAVAAAAAAAAAAASSAASSGATAGLHPASSSGYNAGSEIIVRDPRTGTFAIDAPQLPSSVEPRLEAEEEEAEARRRLIDSWRKHGDHGMVDHNEIKAVLMASLESKVQSLDEDGWMFGDEEKDEE